MKNTLKKITISSALLPILVYSQTQDATLFSSDDIVIKSPVINAKDQLNANIVSMFNDPVMKSANWGFVVYDPKSNKVISSYNENASLIPASTTKLLTTDVAMALFGKDYQWVTQLEHSGNIDENGVLYGNLYIIGSGDPSLGTGRAGASSYATLVSDFISSIKSIGIKRVKGDIVLKTAVFRNNKNFILPSNIVWNGDKEYLLPQGNTTDTDPRKERLLGKKNIEEQKYVYLSPYNKELAYADEFGGISLYTKLPDAPFYLANSLKNNLTKQGVIVEGKVSNQSEPKHNINEERKKINTYYSPKLEDMVYFINQTSNNKMSESLLKITGFYKKGDFSLDTGRITVNEHLTNKTFDFYGFNYADGSGLSRSNVVTPISQVKFLSNLMNERHFDSYFRSLPVGGQTGTLKSMFKNSDSYGQVFAKTGTLNRVKTLAGYVKTKSGRLLAFSLLINNYNGSVNQVKQRMEQILAPIVDIK